MTPEDLLFLTIPASVAALKFGLIAFAVVMISRGIFRPHAARSSTRIKPLFVPRGLRRSRA